MDQDSAHLSEEAPMPRSAASQLQLAGARPDEGQAPRKRRKRHGDDLGMRIGGEQAEHESSDDEAGDSAWAVADAPDSSAAVIRDSVDLVLASPACSPAHLGVLRSLDDLAWSSTDPHVKRDARAAVRRVAEHLAAEFRACATDLTAALEELLALLEDSQDDGTQVAILACFGAAAQGPDEATAVRAVDALARAAAAETFLMGSSDGYIREILRAVCSAIGGASPCAAAAATGALLTLVSERADDDLDEVVVRDIGGALQTAPPAAAEAALSRLLEAGVGGAGADAQLVSEILVRTLGAAGADDVGALVVTLLRGVESWEHSDRQKFLSELDLWMMEDVAPEAGARLLGAIARHFPELRGQRFREGVLDLVAHAFEESLVDELERPALEALTEIAAASDDGEVHHKIADTMRMGLWLGTIGNRNVVRTMRALVRIGGATPSSEAKRVVMDALSNSIWERDGQGAWYEALAEIALMGMAQVAATSDNARVKEALLLNCGETWTKRPVDYVRSYVLEALNISYAVDDPSAMTAIVRHVGATLLSSADLSYTTRTIEWLVQDVMSTASNASVHDAALEVGAALLTSDRIETAFESLFQILVDDLEAHQHQSLQRFAISLLTRCSGKNLKRATALAVSLAMDRRAAWVKLELISWLSQAALLAEQARAGYLLTKAMVDIALHSPAADAAVLSRVVEALRPVLLIATKETVKFAVSSLVRIALRSYDPAVQLPVVTALGDVFSGGEPHRARLAVRGLMKIASVVDPLSLGQGLLRQLAEVARHGDLPNAQLALQGLRSVSTRADPAFREQSWDAAAALLRQPLQPAVRAELDSVMSELMALKESELQESQRHPLALHFAPAA